MNSAKIPLLSGSLAGTVCAVRFAWEESRGINRVYSRARFGALNKGGGRHTRAQELKSTSKWRVKGENA